MNAFDGFTFHALMDWLAAVFLLGGLVFMVIGALGVHRLPDAYNRLHAASKCVTLGLTGMLLAACYHIGTAPVVSKAIITIVFTFVANPMGSHLLAKAAHHAGLLQWDRTLSDDLAEDKASRNRAACDTLLGTSHDAGLDDDAPSEEGEVQAA